MKQERVVGYRLLLFLLVVVILSGCYQKPEYEDTGQEGREVKNQISRYYAFLSEASLHPIEMKGVALTLKQNGEQKSSLITIGSYLFSKGYRVQAISEPRFISYEKPFASYSIDVEVEYPKDYEGKEKKIHTTETVWVDVDSRLLYKIKSKDQFISARVCNFEYDDK